MNPVVTKKLQHVFAKHAADFGVTGPWNVANAARFEKALHDHVNNPAVARISGTYRGTQAVTHYFDPATQRNVMVDTSDDLVSGWRLSAQQVAYLLTTGDVQ